MKEDFSGEQKIPVAPWIVFDGPVTIRVRRSLSGPARSAGSSNSAFFHKAAQRSKKTTSAQATDVWLFEALIGN